SYFRVRERACESIACATEDTSGVGRRRAADGESAHTLLAGDLSRHLAGTDAGTDVDRRRGDTLAADARSAPRVGRRDELCCRPARFGRRLWIVQRAAQRAVARPRLHRRSQRALRVALRTGTGHWFRIDEGDGRRAARPRSLRDEP